MEAKSEPSFSGTGAWQSHRRITAEKEFHLDFHRAIERGARNFTVALSGMTIAGEKETSVDGHWKEQGRTLDQILTVKIAAARCWGKGRLDTRLVKRHSHDSHEWLQAQAITGAADSNAAVRQQFPVGRFGPSRHSDQSRR